jgi:regulator of RNase E activity RraA
LLDLVSPTPGRVLFGPAVTISYFPSCSAGLNPDKYNLANLFYEAVGDEPEGKVVVLASNGYTRTSMGGGTKLSRLQHHGCAGCSRTAACATLTSSPLTTSLLTALVRRRSGEAMR